MDVVELSDQELRQKLLDLGYQPGPIIESTRRVYELKYLKMIGELGSSDSDRECDVTVRKIEIKTFFKLLISNFRN